jgi:nucleoid-associated protein YgaU
MTDPGMPAERASLARPLILVLIGFAVVAGVAAYVLREGRQQAASPTVAALPAPLVTKAPPVAHEPPSFGVVRIDPQGDAVLAGHADPNADVTVRDGTTVLGHAKADPSGDWVLVPDKPLPPGPRQLSLSEQTADNVTVPGTGALAMVVPGPPTSTAPAAPPLALLDRPGAASTLLLGPPGFASKKLGLVTVDYDDQGAPRFAGTAPPGAAVRVYVDSRPAGDAVADARGRWTLTPEAAIAPGPHRLRLDQLDAGGRVTARLALPFLREHLTAAELGGNRVLVQPGENLWRIARDNYGSGLRYTVIYQANQSQIRDPGKIYPGEALNLPPQDTKPVP